MRDVAIANQHPKLRVDRRALIRAIHTLDAHHKDLATPHSVLGHDGELSLVFVTDTALAQLHDQFLDDPTITDVITFEGNAAHGTAGEICVSADAAVRHLTQGPRSGSTTVVPTLDRRKRIDPIAFSREVTLYVIHGWLHLAGYDDLAPAKKRVMRRAEARAMALLEREKTLPTFRLRP